MARPIEVITRPAPKAHNPVKGMLGGMEFRHRVAYLGNAKRHPTRRKAAIRSDLRRLASGD